MPVDDSGAREAVVRDVLRDAAARLAAFRFLVPATGCPSILSSTLSSSNATRLEVSTTIWLLISWDWVSCSLGGAVDGGGMPVDDSGAREAVVRDVLRDAAARLAAFRFLVPATGCPSISSTLSASHCD